MDVIVWASAYLCVCVCVCVLLSDRKWENSIEFSHFSFRLYQMQIFTHFGPYPLVHSWSVLQECIHDTPAAVQWPLIELFLNCIFSSFSSWPPGLQSRNHMTYYFVVCQSTGINCGVNHHKRDQGKKIKLKKKEVLVRWEGNLNLPHRLCSKCPATCSLDHESYIKNVTVATGAF